MAENPRLYYLHEKAAKLPMTPGVYIMKDKSNKIIYIGKAKKLKNRVGQYFAFKSSHTPKVAKMVENVHDFDYILTDSEFEALVLECSLIKQHKPKYNILLKDDKGYPYLRLDMRDAYPRITMVSKPADDGAVYYGPFGSRGVTADSMAAINASLMLPVCNKQFPKDIGKGRPCLNYHMNQCAGWCQKGTCQSQYRKQAEQAKQL